MKKITRWIGIGVMPLLLLSASCASQEDFDALEADYMELKAELRAWGDSVTNWAGPTSGAICDIVAKNPATYASQTEGYCEDGTEPDGELDPPPVFGAD